jgi:hypothetical protein
MGLFDSIGGVVEDVTGINIGATSSTDRALREQRDATAAANATQRYIYDTTRADQQPWRDAGGYALRDLLYGMGHQTSSAPGLSQAESTRLSELLSLQNSASTSKQTGLPVDAGGGKSAAQLWGEAHGPGGIGSAVAAIVGRQGAASAARGLTAAQQKELSGLQDRQRAYESGLVRGDGQGDLTRDFSMADFQKDPGYQFRMQEGQKAIERSAAARGGLNSGATLKALSRYGQDFASNEYTNAYNRFNSDRDRRFNRLSSLAGIGQTASGQLMQAGQNYGNNVSANQIGYGNAAGAANIARGQRTVDFINQGIQTGAQLLAFSDARLKTDVKPVSEADLAELRRTLKPYTFKYLSEEHGRGEWIGVMAQDLLRSKLGRLVVFRHQGKLCIDQIKLNSLLLATLAKGAA